MLKVVAICCARDGSTSLREIVRGFYRENGMPLDLGYVSHTFDLWPAILSYIRDDDMDFLHNVLMRFDNSVEISHGFAFFLPVLRVIFGPKLKIIRIVREIEPHVRSLAKRVHINPDHWGGYSEHSTPDTLMRPTAVDYNETTEDKWNDLPVKDKFRWFVRKQQELLDKHLFLFDDVITVKTEQLSDPDVIWRIGYFINPNWKKAPLPVHVHRTDIIDIENLPKSSIKAIEGTAEQLDFERMLSDDGYAVEFFIEILLKKFRENPEKYRSYVENLAHKLSSDLTSVRLKRDS